MPDRNARLARLMEVLMVESPFAGKAWQWPDDGEWHRCPPPYDSPDAPRCLIESVEQEIERRGMTYEYARAMLEAMRTDEAAWYVATAPASTRVDAAIEVLGGKE